MDTISKTLSPRERKAYVKLKAGLKQANQSAGPATQVAQSKPAPQRAHRVQHRHGGRDDGAVPDSVTLWRLV
ncbi:hypothetical protein ACVWY2_003230 [Bradyrhizobium sp. JR6.1]